MSQITLYPRIVQKVPTGFLVVERRKDGWHPITKVYPHSTSAYSRLGHIVQAKTKEQLGDKLKMPVTPRKKRSSPQ